MAARSTQLGRRTAFGGTTPLATARRTMEPLMLLTTSKPCRIRRSHAYASLLILVPLKDPQVKRRIKLKILDRQPGMGGTAAKVTQEQGARGTKKGWCHRDHHIRQPKPLSKEWRQTCEGNALPNGAAASVRWAWRELSGDSTSPWHRQGTHRGTCCHPSTGKPNSKFSRVFTNPHRLRKKLMP